jgi:hypothetical protein
MNDTVHNLVAAIKTGDALSTEQAFADAMAVKLGAAIETKRQQVAASMFSTEQSSDNVTDNTDETV